MLPEALPLSVLQAHWRSLSQAMPAATAGDVEAIHDARVASRRLREALPVLGAGAPPATVRHLRKRVRRVTRALGPVREVDVALASLNEAAPRLGLSAPTVQLLRDALVAARRRRRSAMLDAMRVVRLDRLSRWVDRLAAPDAAEVFSPETRIHEAVRRVGRRAERLERSIDHAGALYLPDRLHAVRVCAKKLRYAMEVERDLRQSRAGHRIGQLKAMQELLGGMHDTEVLAGQTRLVEDTVPAIRVQVVAELKGLVRSLEDQCRVLHAAYLGKRTALLQLCAAIRAAADAGRSTVAA